jgi:hypothetical protein
MNDSYVLPPNPAPMYPQPRLRVEANYPDRGEGPESVVVEVNDQAVTPELVAEIVATLTTLPGAHHPIDATSVNAELIDATHGGAR